MNVRKMRVSLLTDKKISKYELSHFNIIGERIDSLTHKIKTIAIKKNYNTHTHTLIREVIKKKNKNLNEK